ncbi:MAG TPA: hypothetical protein VHI51_21960 [Ktedonobacterales bacterium]|jgi:DNA-binding NtrC family response regulator|nr:hypothetical protein [Ktedonobacterales bacterium]
MSEPDTSDEAPQERATRYALLLDPDLFFAVKVAAMLKRIGFETTTVRRAPEWAQRVAEGRYSVALVNTAAGAGWREAIAAAREARLPVIAYGSHVDVETQAEARAAGATRVIANSKLATDLPAIVEQTLRRAEGA